MRTPTSNFMLFSEIPNKLEWSDEVAYVQEAHWKIVTSIGARNDWALTNRIASIGGNMVGEQLKSNIQSFCARCVLPLLCWSSAKWERLHEIVTSPLNKLPFVKSISETWTANGHLSDNPSKLPCNCANQVVWRPMTDSCTLFPAVLAAPAPAPPLLKSLHVGLPSTCSAQSWN